MYVAFGSFRTTRSLNLSTAARTLGGRLLEAEGGQGSHAYAGHGRLGG